MDKKAHRRRAISLEMKIEILDRLAKGERSTAIGKRYTLGESTIRAIKKNEDAIRESVVSGTRLSAKFSSYSRDVLLEKTESALVTWIKVLTQKKIPISGYLIKQRALLFYKHMKQSEPSTSASQTDKEFSASSGWLTGFLKRNAIHNMKITTETASMDENPAKNENGGCCGDELFDVVDAGLFWKKTPRRTYIPKSEEDRVTSSIDASLKPFPVNENLRKGKDFR
jgi:hypothetical protein